MSTLETLVASHPEGVATGIDMVALSELLDPSEALRSGANDATDSIEE
ncbi:hypothetical protein [Natronorubrum tibetense]|nr:hypothetical protein [Natronorubrum tibetense]